MLIWGGGPYHPTRAQGQWFSETFIPQGFSVDYREDRAAFSGSSLAKTDLLVLAGMDDAKFTPEAEGTTWETPTNRKTVYQPLEDEYFEALIGYLAKGKPLLVHHGAILSFLERKELAEIFDGRWVLGQTFHPPYQKFKVECVTTSHPTLAGISDFEIEDELYCDLTPPRHSSLLMRATWEGKQQSLAWAGNHGPSRVLYSGLGHDMNSLANPNLQRFLKNSVAWLMKG